MRNTDDDEASCDFLDRHTVRFIRELPHSVDRVWAAITDPTEIAHWFIGPARVDLRRGGSYRFGLHFAGQIQACDPPRLLELDGWRFELDPIAGGTRLTFTAWVSPGFTFKGADADGPGGDQPFGPGTWYPGTLAGWHGMLRDLRRTLDDGLDYGFGSPTGVPSNAEADNADRTAALMDAYRQIEIASPVLAASAWEDPVDPEPGRPVLIYAVSDQTDERIAAFAEEFGGLRDLCFTVLEGFASQVAPFRMAPPGFDCRVGFDLGADGAWTMSIAEGTCRLFDGVGDARARLQMSAPDYLRLVSGAESLDDLRESGRVAMTGNTDEVHALIELAQSRQGPYFAAVDP